jgi:hypothetical protein
MSGTVLLRLVYAFRRWTGTNLARYKRTVVNGEAKGGYTLVTLPRNVTPYRDNADGTRDHVAYQKLVTR